MSEQNQIEKMKQIGAKPDNSDRTSADTQVARMAEQMGHGANPKPVRTALGADGNPTRETTIAALRVFGAVAPEPIAVVPASPPGGSSVSVVPPTAKT